MYKAVCFDVGGVLTHPIGPVFHRQATGAGLDVDESFAAMMADFASHDDGDAPAHRLERGEIRLDEFFAIIGRESSPVRVLMDPDSPHYVPGAFTPHEGMHALVAEVRAAGLATGIISNVATEWLPAWHRVMPPLDLFDVIVDSCSVGMRKPNTSIFHFAAGALGVAPAEIVFLEDFPANADAAEAVGMTVVRVSDHDVAIAEVRRLLREATA